MEKENKLTTKQETKDTEIVELKDENLSTITVGSDDQDLEKLHCRRCVELGLKGIPEFSNVFNDNIFITSEAN
ncbi:MAG: hypothetical protein MJ247_06175 [Alphaproteobacteria bacterium]|nr:hypothetical protein [Alphaproteobacteria bacterium]